MERLKKNTKLRAALFANGIKQRELAHKARISEATISKIINGYRKPTEAQKVAIANVLKSSIERLF